MCDETYTPEKQEFSEKEWNLIYTAVIDRFTESKEGVPMDDIENRYKGQLWELCVKISEHRQALELSDRYHKTWGHDLHHYL